MLLVMGRPEDEPWRCRVLDSMPPSIDVDQLRRNASG